MTGGGYSRVAAASTKAKFNNKPQGGAGYAAAAADAVAAVSPMAMRASFFAAQVAAAFAGSARRMGRVKSRRRRPTRYAPNGGAECERRRRQIAAGQLRAENGLIRE